jgi:Methylamine utilisation protein MauE
VWVAEALRLGALAIAVVFLTAAVGKLANWSTWLGELRDYDLLPRAAVAAVGAFVPALEIAGALSLLVPPTRALGLALLTGLLLAFSAVLARTLARGKRSLRCACFGASSQYVSWALPIRNVVMATVLGGALLIGPTTGGAPNLSVWIVATLASAIIWCVLEFLRAMALVNSTDSVQGRAEPST